MSVQNPLVLGSILGCCIKYKNIVGIIGLIVIHQQHLYIDI